MPGSTQDLFSQLTKLPSATADSDAQVGLGIRSSITKPSLSGHFLYTGRWAQFSNMIKPRKPFAALLLSLIPGLGQFYNGHIVKSAFFLLLDLLLPIAFGLTGILLNVNGLIVALVSAITFIFYRLIDGFISAQKLKHYELKTYNRWYFYLLFASMAITIRIFLDFPASTGTQTFKIQTSSMSPTMKPNDRVVADLRFYKKRPIDYGDIVVFNSPQGGIWTFRVIGLPKDSIEIVDGMTYVNGDLNETSKIKEDKVDSQDAVEFLETLKNGKKIETIRFLTNPNQVDTRTMDKRIIPENEYFLMVDNRDNAFDSRFIGTIKKNDIIGRVIYSYWGDTSDRRNIDLTAK